MANVICADIRSLLDETSAVFWTTTNVLNAVNEAVLESEADARALIGTATITVTSEFTALPVTSLFIPQRIIGTAGDTGTPVEYWIIKQTDLERFWSGWREADTTDPKFFILWDSRYLRAWPVPTTAKVYTLEGILWPTEITTETATLDVEHELYHSIMYRAAALLIDETLPQTAELYNSQADEHMKEYKKLLRNRGGHVIKSLRPATRGQIAQQGSLRVGRRYS